jgi:NAD(P)H-dependent flavin oxidoreductase YrpB (nitropropane dioxygenase family)
MDMKDVRKTAKERMKGYCQVCAVCDGRACADQVPGMGGLGTGSSFTANLRALAARRFNMRLIHGASTPRTEVEILGQRLAMPVLAAPIGGVSFNMGGGVSEEDYIKAVLKGYLSRGVLGCTGDGIPPFIIDAALAALAEVGGRGVPFIKPWADQELGEKMARVKGVNPVLVGMDIDAAGLVTLALMGRPVSPKPLEKLTEIIAASPAPFIVKGVMTPADAALAARAGAKAIVVSNHGGRVLDHTPGTAEALPAIAAAVKGQVTILVDGGVRTGGDVLKMLALGADAVMIGRPISVAAVCGLEEGVTAYLDQIKSELTAAMVLTGTAEASQVSPDILAPLA